MPTINTRRMHPFVLAPCALAGGLWAAQPATAQVQPPPEDPVEISVPGRISALIFNDLFNVGGIGDRTPGQFVGSDGCGRTDTSEGRLGGQSLSNVLNASLATPEYDDDDQVEQNNNRSLARNLWRFCDNLYEQGGQWTVFSIDADRERLQSAGMAPDELFAQIDQAAMLTRAQVSSVGSRVKQMRLAALGYEQEALLASDGTVSVDLDVGRDSASVDIVRGLNASGEVPEGFESRLSIWANIRYVDIGADTTATEIGSKTDGLGAVFGLDYLFSDSFFGGFSIGVTELDTEFEPIMGQPTGQSDVENTALQFIWSYFPNDRLYLNGVVGFSDLEFDNTKFVPAFDMDAPGSTPFAPLDSAPDGSTEFANLVLGYDVRKESVTFSPYLRLEYLDTEIDGFTERPRMGDDATLALTVQEQENTSVTGTVGAQLSFPRSTQSGIWMPYLRAELVKEFEEQSDTLAGFLTVIPEARFELAPAETDEEYGYFGIGLSGQLRNGWAVFLDYDSLVGFDDLDSWQATFGFRKEL